MSARGVTGRSDLFVSARSEAHNDRDGAGRSKPKEPIGEEGMEDPSERYGLSGAADDNPLQLEHMMGYSGDFKHTVLAISHNENIFVKGMGCLVCIENLADPHDQKILRSHDMPVSALAVSPSGRLIASGQVGTNSYKGYGAPIVVWHTDSCRRIIALKGLTRQVNLIGFSADDCFVCGAGQDGLLYIWDIETGETLTGQKMPSEVSVLRWVDQRKVNHYTSYDLVIGHSNILLYATLSYAAERGQWVLSMQPFTMPPGGNLIRSYLSLDVSNDGVFVYVGTTGGEMMVFRRDTGVFRACIPVCTGGTQSVVSLPNNDVVCSGGDGSICRLQGSDMSWRIVKEGRLESGIRSGSLSANGNELIVGCASGSVYRCLASTLSSHVVGVSHTSPITCIAFDSRGPQQSSSSSSSSSALFVTGIRSGEMRVWDITDYACVAMNRYPKSGAVLCLFMLGGSVLSGWEDGTVRCNDTGTLADQRWLIVAAHRNGVTSVAAYADNAVQYLVTGGGDGAVRVWRLGNRELLTQYTEHQKSVSKVLVDVRSPHIIHSVGLDSSVLSYDIKSNRRIISHIVTMGAMTWMTQRRDSEQELVACDTLGRLLHFDIDVREPVEAVQDPSQAPLRCCAVSPSGRYLAFAGDDQLVKVLELATGAVCALGQGHSGAVKTLAWTLDERQLITGGDDMCLCVWNFYLGGAPSTNEGGGGAAVNSNTSYLGRK